MLFRSGLPLDNRATYTKSDWIMWTASLTGDINDFNALVDNVYKYANETHSRVPVSDWHDTKTAERMNFKARSVVGGYYMKLLEQKLMNMEQAVKKYQEYVDGLEEYLQVPEFNPSLVKELVNKILVSDDGRVEIGFKCQDVFQNELVLEYMGEKQMEEVEV